MAAIEVEVANVNDLKNGEMKEVSLGSSKALLSRVNDKYYATSHLCTHYKAPLIKGTLADDGRVMCPWHGACFRVQTGDIEDGPSVDGLVKFETFVKGDKVFVKATAEDMKAGRKVPKCTKKNTSNQKTVVVLGGGAGGLVTVESLRQNGFDGRIILVSREAYLPIDRPKLSKALQVEATKIALRDDAFFKDLDIEVHLATEAKDVDVVAKAVSLSNGAKLSYDYLVLATGGDPRTLPIPGKDLKNVFTLRGVQDANSIEQAVAAFTKDDAKPNVVIVGSSFIGMEAASVLAKKANITVIGMEKVPYERVLGPKIGAAMQALSEQNGVKLKMEAMVDRFEAAAADNNRIGAVVLKSGESIPADVVVIGAGVVPKTDYLPKSQEGGIVVDRDQGITVETSMKVPGVDGVFAVGDLARYPYHLTGEQVRVEHWNVAQNQGRVVGANIAKLGKGGKDVKLEPFNAVPYFWTVQFGKSIRYAGHAHSFDDVIIQGSLDLDSSGGGLSFVAFYTRGEKVLAVASLMRDPAVSHASELLRLGKMPSASQLKKGLDILTVPLKSA
ncbi:hypothetical protein HK102_008621 [Quaeritorhiza haematococci]|nr:hypothetical protein HK102_008621 [Quaeritorhiza haematococci]